MSKNTILASVQSDARQEFVAAGTITPGMVIEVTSAGKVQAHSVASGSLVPLMIAIENDLVGNDKADNYSAADTTLCYCPQRGDEVFLLVADGQNIAVGTKLESDGAGKVQAVTLDSTGIYRYQSMIGVALTAVDMSGSAGADPTDQLIRVLVA